MNATPRPSEFDAEQPVIDAIRQGDRYAFAELVQRHDRWVRSVAYGVLGDSRHIDDVTQQTWMAFWQRINELRDPERWRAWLYRLARNAAIDAGRDVSRRRARHVSGDEHLLAFAVATSPAAATDGTPHQSVVDDEQRGIVSEAIAALPPLYREPLVLRHVNGWSYREIADVMALPVDTVETRLVRARRQLREALKGHMDE